MFSVLDFLDELDGGIDLFDGALAIVVMAGLLLALLITVAVPFREEPL